MKDINGLKDVLYLTTKVCAGLIIVSSMLVLTAGLIIKIGAFIVKFLCL